VSVVNGSLEILREEFEVELEEERTLNQPIDGMNLYLYGLVLQNLQLTDKYVQYLSKQTNKQALCDDDDNDGYLMSCSI
jgi:predicted metal-dependent RNase